MRRQQLGQNNQRINVYKSEQSYTQQEYWKVQSPTHLGQFIIQHPRTENEIIADWLNNILATNKASVPTTYHKKQA